MNKELIECAKNYLEYQSIGNASKLRAAIENIENSIDSSQEKTPKVGNNEKARKDCASCKRNNEIWGDECEFCGGNYSNWVQSV